MDSGVIPQEDLVVYPNVSAAIVDLRSGNLDVALMGEQTAEQAMKNADDLKLVGEGFYQQQYAIAVPKGSNLTDQAQPGTGGAAERRHVCRAGQALPG